MRHRVVSYRNGLRVLHTSEALDEISDALASITLDEVEARRSARQTSADAAAAITGKTPRKAGIQDGLNNLIKERLLERGWSAATKVFEMEEETRKGVWVMDFSKRYVDDGATVGLEVTFNHGEALAWTPMRLTLAHEAEGVLEGARIDVGVIVIGTDGLKGSAKTGLRMDSAVGTFERLLTLLPKMRAVLPAPLVIFGLEWADGGRVLPYQQLGLHGARASLSPLVLSDADG